MSDGTLSPLEHRRESVTDIVYTSIRAAIIGRDLAPGAPVTEAALSAQLSVSKTPVREALLRLTHIGLIEPDPRRGSRVVVPSRGALRESYEVRIAVECEAARLVAERALSVPELAGLEDLARRSVARAESDDHEGFWELDREFHLLMADLAGNARLGLLVEDAVDLAWILRRRDSPSADASVACARQHVDLHAAVAAADPARAEAAMRLHLTDVQDTVLAAFTEP
ncbi:GntR family transcriptional regulator [Jiangella mangrovi]|uniref:DNA-binding GntR family transcriptional regulator n=1 Tax=Jiangella mangrovi TaxID=1524084 RepID=A0A7W9GRW0_9ACTN|nr:GntR family transcriptional regulator [Jiangella mangrovi]MBB5788586.1 DNA-binding GntR family transcriptional regulator [Jiangella mangrovi]